MKNFLEYKGYHTKVEFNSETMTLRGKIEGINDYIDFECEDIKNVEQEFHSAVDDYLEFCKEIGKAPEKEYLPSVEPKPDRCDGCKNLPRFSHEEPCKSCANNYINKYER